MITRATAKKLLALAMNHAASDAERRTAALKVCEWLAASDVLMTSQEKRRRPGNIYQRTDGTWRISWRRHVAIYLGISRDENACTRDEGVARETLDRRMRELGLR